MMRLRTRQDDRVLLVEAPAGSYLRAAGRGRVLVVPGPRLLDTAAVIDATRLVSAVRAGVHGLRLRAIERIPATALTT